jgi:glycosyltransferase involved in cell wall biosynthesis
MRIAVAQLGARMHYAVPKILERAKRLEHFYTDICASKGWPRALKPLTHLPGASALRRFMDRVPQDVPSEKISAYNGLGIRYAIRRARAKTADEQAKVFLWAGQAFCKELIRSGLGDASHTFSYNSAGLEWMRYAKSRGLKNILEQTIAPKEFELQLLNAEQQRFPGWEISQAGAASSLLAEYCQREKAEWDEADLILCGSQFVKDGIAACGGPLSRCEVVPYGVDADPHPIERLTHEGPLRILTVGAVGLRKGSPYVLEAAKRCKSICEFKMVGPLTASADALRELSAELTLSGPVPRSSIRQHYAWADVFFLPSVCEGSATVIYEALAAGLPVLTTPNAGSVVSDGEDGWIVPLAGLDQMVDRLTWISKNREVLGEFSSRALEKAKKYGVASYGQRLLQSLDKI